MLDRRSNFEYEDLLACGRGELFADGPQLPLPPMLMFDRISEMRSNISIGGSGSCGPAVKSSPRPQASRSS